MPWIRYCARCEEPLSPYVQASALFHSGACRQAWSRALQVVRQDYPLLAQLEELLKPLKRQRLKAVAPGAELSPAEVHHYELSIRISGVGWRYPAQNRRSLRFDLVERSRQGFRIQPFEPPMVPARGTYNLTIHAENGDLLELPPGIHWLQEVQPCRLISPEDGDLLPSREKH